MRARCRGPLAGVFEPHSPRLSAMGGTGPLNMRRALLACGDCAPACQLTGCLAVLARGPETRVVPAVCCQLGGAILRIFEVLCVPFVFHGNILPGQPGFENWVAASAILGACVACAWRIHRPPRRRHDGTALCPPPTGRPAAPPAALRAACDAQEQSAMLRGCGAVRRWRAQRHPCQFALKGAECAAPSGDGRLGRSHVPSRNAWK